MSAVPTDQPVNYAVLHKCLLVCLLSQMCLCTIYTATAALRTGFSYAYPIKIYTGMNNFIN